MRAIITGGTGLIGRAVARELAAGGYEVIVLSRNPDKAHHLPSGVRAERWNGRTADGWCDLVNGDTAIINLAGESIGIPPMPWTAARKQRILQSRIDAGHAVADAVAKATYKPRVLIQSSAIGYYGLHADEIVTEKQTPGSDFLSRIAVDWEASTDSVEKLGVRRAIIRTGVVFTRNAGVLPYYELPFRFFAGGPLGSGKQWVSWIHMADEVGAIRFLIETESARGAFNLTAPNPLPEAQLSRILGDVMKRPSWIPAPAFALKLALGEMADLLLLGGQRVVPERLQQAGYTFKFSEIEPALRDLI